jgi:hypothetical protein
LSPRTDNDEFTSIPSRTFTPAETWYNRLIGFAFHITLISLFETVFYFQFISKAEDSGLQHTIDGYVNGILNSCTSWPANTTLFVEEVLSLLINITQVAQQDQISRLARQSWNRDLQIQAWCYVAGLVFTLTITVLIGHQASLRLAWKRILLENAIMVTLLGIYEFIFFKTIIYKYESITLPELNSFLVSQLQQTCNLLVPV